jgi:hypothetical protein
MESLRWKTRISALWIILTVNFSAFLFLNLIESTSRKELLETRASEETMGRIAFLFFVPFIMAWLSQTLKDSANRWTNLILAILFAVLFVGELIGFFNAGRPTPILVDTFFALVVNLLIIWYAWKWPKREGEPAV